MPASFSDLLQIFTWEFGLRKAQLQIFFVFSVGITKRLTDLELKGIKKWNLGVYHNMCQLSSREGHFKGIDEKVLILDGKRKNMTAAYETTIGIVEAQWLCCDYCNL